MATFTFSGRDTRGRRRRGRLVAEDRRAAVQRLQRRGITVRSLRRRVLADAMAADLGALRRRLPLSETAWLFRNLASLQRNGVLLPAACELLADQRAGRRTGRLLSSVQSRLEAGAGVADAFEAHRRELGSVPVSMIAAGEASGSLQTTFSGVASLCDTQERVRSNIRRALSYPLTVVVTILLLLVGMIYFIIPRFEEMYADLGADLPRLTTVVVDICVTVADQGWLIPIVVSLLVITVTTVRQLPNGRLVLDLAVLRTPRVGPLVERAVTARCTKTLGSLLASGVPMLDALALTGRAAGNLAVRHSFEDVADAVAAGDSVTVAFAGAHRLPEIVRELAAVGDATGDLPGVLLRHAEAAEEEVRTDGEGFGRTLEPLLVVVMGSLVGLVIIALYLPVFDLAKSIR